MDYAWRQQRDAWAHHLKQGAQVRVLAEQYNLLMEEHPELKGKLMIERRGDYHHLRVEPFFLDQLRQGVRHDKDLTWPTLAEVEHRKVTITALRFLRGLVTGSLSVDAAADWLESIEGTQIWPLSPGEELNHKLRQGGYDLPRNMPDYLSRVWGEVEDFFEHLDDDGDIGMNSDGVFDSTPKGELGDRVYAITPVDTPLMQKILEEGPQGPIYVGESPVRTYLPSGHAEAMWTRLERVCPAALRFGDRALVVIHSAFTWDIAVVDLAAPETDGMIFHGRWGYTSLNRAMEAFKLWKANEFINEPPAYSVRHKERT